MKKINLKPIMCSNFTLFLFDFIESRLKKQKEEKKSAKCHAKYFDFIGLIDLISIVGNLNSRCSNDTK